MNLFSRRKRRGQSLIEVVAASTIVVVALVPALRLVRDSISIDADIEQNEALATLATSKLEECMAKTAANWTVGTSAGDFASIGYASIKWQATLADDTGSGGLPSQLMTISVVAYVDRNGNNSPDSGDRRVQFATKLARTATYEDEAKN